MSHENMYVAEKELCKGTLIEIDKLNDVKGIGRQKKREKKPAPPPKETVLECRGGVMARVSVASRSCAGAAASDPSEPFVADGGELLAGLSAEQRSAILHGEPHGTALSSLDFSRPAVPEPPGSNARAAGSGRAAAPSWVRRRKGSKPHVRQWQALAAEAETDDEVEEREDQHQQSRPRLEPPPKRRAAVAAEHKKGPRSSQHQLSFAMDEGDD